MPISGPHLHRAARIVLLRDLSASGELEGMTLDEIAHALQVKHRSTILRTLRDIEAVETELIRLRRLWNSPRQ